MPHVSTYAGPRNKGTEQAERGGEVEMQGRAEPKNERRHGDEARFAQMKRHESDTRQGGRNWKEAGVQKGEWQLMGSRGSSGGGGGERELEQTPLNVQPKTAGND